MSEPNTSNLTQGFGSGLITPGVEHVVFNAFEQSPAPLFLVDSEGQLELVNAAFGRLSGFPASALVQKKLKELCAPEQAGVVEHLFAQGARAAPPITEDFTLIRNNGQRVELRVCANPILNEGEVCGFHCHAHDITERKQVEAALRNAEEKENARRLELETVLQAVPAMIWITHDPECRHMSGNHAVYEMLNLPRASNVSLSAPEGERPKSHQFYRNGVLVRPEDLPVQRAARKGESVRGDELELRFADGTSRWIHGNSEPLRDAQGQVCGAVGAMVDITERKQAEAALRQSEQRLALAVQGAGGGVWELDLETGDNLWAQGMADLLGVPPQETATESKRWLEYIYHEDRERVMRQVRCAVDGDTHPWTNEYRVVRRDGAVRWVASRGAVLAFPSGHRKIIGVALDITSRKQIEQALRESEERFKVLAEATFEGIAISEQGRIVDANPQLSRVLGYSREELIGREIIPLICEEDRVRVMGNILEGRESEMEHRIIRSDGQIIDIEAHGRTVFQGDRAVRYTAIRDITARKRFEDEILRQKESFRRLAENCPDVIVRLDGQFRYLYVNPVIEQMTGLKPEQCVGRINEALGMPPELCSKWNSRLTEVFTTGQKVSFEFEIPAPDSRLHYYQMTMVPEFNAMASVESVLGITHDVTGLVRAEEALRRVKDDLVQANARLEQTVEDRTAKLRETVADLERYSYSIAHDMRAPLRTMRAFSQMLLTEEMQEMSPQAQDYLRRIVAGAERLDRLIQDVLNYSRISKAETCSEVVNLDALVRQVVDQYPGLQSPQAQVEVVSPLLTIQGNVALVTQCLSNLLCNAAKFVVPGVIPRIKVRTEARQDMVRLWVEDNGIGIAPEHQERIFGIFERLHRSEDYDGTGIGLSIVLKAVERMGGKAGVESEPGKGSRFWLDLKSARHNPQGPKEG